jgi:hypothetical protein
MSCARKARNCPSRSGQSTQCQKKMAVRTQSTAGGSANQLELVPQELVIDLVVELDLGCFDDCT